MFFNIERDWIIQLENPSSSIISSHPENGSSSTTTVQEQTHPLKHLFQRAPFYGPQLIDGSEWGWMAITGAGKVRHLNKFKYSLILSSNATSLFIYIFISLFF